MASARSSSKMSTPKGDLTGQSGDVGIMKAVAMVSRQSLSAIALNSSVDGQSQRRAKRAEHQHSSGVPKWLSGYAQCL